MSTEENKAIIRHGIEDFNQGDMTEFSLRTDEAVSPDFVFHDPNIPFPGGIRSREDYKQFLIGYHTALPGQFTIEDLVVEGKAVEAWQNADNLSLLRQLGLIPA